MSLKNKVMLTGRLGADPEVSTMPDETKVAKLRLATDESYKNKDGQKVVQTEWHQCKAFGKLAEIIGEYASKGRLVQCEGKIRTRKWTDKDNIDRWTTEVILNDLILLDRKPDADAPAANAEQASAVTAVHDDVPF